MNDPIREALLASVRYPSADNMQPFRCVRESATRYRIRFFPKESSHPLNQNAAADWITFGHLAESIRLESQVRGFDVKIEADFAATPEGAVLYFSKSFRPMAEIDRQLQMQLGLRETNRGGFSKRVPDSSLIEKLESLMVGENSLHAVPDVSMEFQRNALDVEHRLWKWEKFGRSTLSSTKLIWDRPPSVGLNPRALGTSYLSALAIPLIRDSKVLYEVAILLGAAFINRGLLKRQLRNTGWLGFYRTTALSGSNLYNLGRSNLRIWTELNARGFGFQPLTGATLSTAYLSTGGSTTEWPSEVKTSLEAMSDVYSRMFSGPGFVVWGFRSGGADPLAPAMRSGRRSWILDETSANTWRT